MTARTKIPKRHAPQAAAESSQCKKGAHGGCAKLNCLCPCHFDVEVDPSERVDALDDLTNL